MLKAYGLYKKIRNASWQALIDNKINSLPVNIAKIASDNGIEIVKNSKVNKLREGEKGISIFDSDTCFIVYDDTIQSVSKRIFVISHELAHIFSGHPLSGDNIKKIENKDPRIEREADSFAIRLLAPACVLWGLNLRTADEIAEVCNLDIESARKRATRMRELYKREKFLTEPLEKKVFAQFEEYIEKSKALPNRNNTHI